MEFSELYKHYDQQEAQSFRFRKDLEGQLSKDYLSFFEQFKRYTKLDRLTLSLLFGLALFLLHLGASLIDEDSDQNLIIEDFSFFLAILNAAGLYLVFNATAKFREFLVNLIQLTKDDDKATAEFFLNTYKTKFLSSRTLYYGFLFGIINSGLALVFGVCYLQLGQYYLLSTFLLQVFTIGFIGGVTVSATTVIVSLINRVSLEEDINLTYFYPDKCAGTLVIGNILFLFSIHFIIIGILIFLFIHNFQWTSIEAGDYYVHALIVLWKVFPFILSAIIFFIPTRKLNLILKEYKLFEQLKIRKRMNYLTGIIMSLESDRDESKEKIEILDNHYQKLVKIDQEIGELNTWPYNLRHRTTFLSIFLPVVIGVILELSKKIISGMF